MEYTENYHLPQWEPTDRVLREDFNDAMSDIDDALKANADSVTELANRSRFTKLKEVNITTNTDPVTINLAEINWTEWDKVHLDCFLSNSGSRHMYYNDASQNTNRFYTVDSGAPINMFMPRLTFDVGFNAQRAVSASPGNHYTGSPFPYAQLQKILIVGGVYAGSQIILWGEK